MKNTHTQSGFTLVELMVVVGIIAILAGIAFPMYSDYVTKSHRSQAKVALSTLSQEQETFKADNIQTYATGFADTTDVGAGLLGCKRVCQDDNGRWVTGDRSATNDRHYYTLEMATIPGRTGFTTGFAITAEAIGDQAVREAGMNANLRCPAFAIDSLNRKASGADAAAARANLATNTDANDCWN